MTAQAGKNIYLQDGTGTGAVPIAAMRSTTVTLDGKTVDVTSRDSAGFQELLASGGIVKLSVKSDFVLTDSTWPSTIATRLVNQSLLPYTVNFGSTHTAVANFQVVQWEAKGQYNNEQTYSLSLESSGSITLA